MEAEKGRKKAKLAAEIYDWFELIAGCIAVLVLIFFFFVKSYTVSGASMEPGLIGGYRVLVSSVGHSPRAGDIVVIERESSDGKNLIKRVIAVGGQTVDMDLESGEITVDGMPAYHVDVDDLDNLRGDISYPVTVPEGCVFVLGDNRSVSLDSRYSAVGCPDANDIVGRALLIYSPFSEFGRIW